MPEMDGFTATRRIRQIEAGESDRPRIQIIALTANAIQGDRDACIASGMDDYVTKPIDPDALLQTLEKYLGPSTGQGDDTAESAATRPIPDVAPVDAKSLLHRCRGKSDLAMRLLRTFSDGMNAQLNELRQTLQSRDWPLLLRTAHTIKGASANLSAERVSAAASSLELLGQTADVDASLEALQRLDAAMRECREYINAIPSAAALAAENAGKS